MQQKSVVLTLQQKDVEEIVKALVENSETNDTQLRKSFIGIYSDLLDVNDPICYRKIKKENPHPL